MPFALILVGALLLIAGVRNKQDKLYTLVKGDFTGQHNFIFWVVAILAVGSVGYVKTLKPLSDMFLALIIVVLFLANKGFFAAFTTQINATQQPSLSTLQNLPTIQTLPNLNVLPSLGVNQ